MMRSISPASRTSTGLNSTPNDGATAWTAPNCPIPEAMAGSPMHRRPRHAGRDLFEQLQPFYAHAVFVIHEPSRVAARPRHARDETGADRVDDSHEHNRQGAGRMQQWRHGCGASSSDEDVRRERNQFRRKVGPPVNNQPSSEFLGGKCRLNHSREPRR